MKKILTIVLLMTFLTGCGTVEVNERVFVSSFYVEKSAGLYTVTVDYTLADGNDSRMSAGGKSVADAMSEISSLLGKNVFSGHCRLLFVGDGVDEPYSSLLWFAESERLAPDAIICRADEKILSADNFTDAYEVLSGAAERGLPDGQITRVFSRLARDEVAIVPYAALSGGFMSVAGGELVEKDRFLGKLTEKETVGAMLLLGKKVKTVLTDGEISADVTLSPKGRKIYFDGKNPHVTLNITVSGDANADIKYASEMIADELSERIFSATDLAAYVGSDFVGMKNLVKKQHPSRYDTLDTKELLSECSYEAVLTFKVYEKTKY